MDLNLNLLPVFEAVYRTKSMTEAAKELYLTQSGVSQHIRTLEEYVGASLFDRYRHRLLPTEKGEEFFRICHQSLNIFRNGIVELSDKTREIKGKVRIGMPIEFGNSIILPLLAQFHKLHPKVSYEFELGFASTMNRMLLTGELDYAFVDDFKMDSLIEVKIIQEEFLDLCVHRSLINPKKISKKTFSQLSYVEYARGDDVLNLWFDFHYHYRPKLHIAAYIMDVQGLAKLIVEGVGAGILPRYVASKLKASGKDIYVFRGSGRVLRNAIRLAKLRDRTLSIAAQESKAWLEEHLDAMMKAKRQGS